MAAGFLPDSKNEDVRTLTDRVARSVDASFNAVDDLLWQSEFGQLSELPPLRLVRSGRIGPLVELAIATRMQSDAYRRITVEPPIYLQIARALSDGAISGASTNDRSGAFPLRRLDPSHKAANLLWDQWAKHVENAAVVAGLPRSLVAGLMGALGELQDNVFEHSGVSDTGVVAYGVSSGSFEFVVADAGRGVLATLRDNPDFAHLLDDGAALRVAVSDGASRHARETGHGYGIGQLFRALAHDAAELRFRSGDHALRLWGDAPSLTGQVELAQKARLDGLTVTVRCVPRTARQGL